MKKSVQLILAGTLLLGLTACAGEGHSNRQMLIKKSNYWQRAAVSDAALADGPKTQQMLQRDIARCTTELTELEHLGSLKNAMPAESTRYRRPQDRENQVSKWDTPDHDEYMLAERGVYHDFETCMIDKGWERLEHVPYDISKKDREDYVDAIRGQRFRSKMGYRDRDPDYTNDKPRHNNDYKATGINQ